MFALPPSNPRRGHLPKLQLSFLTAYVLKFLKYPRVVSQKLLPARNTRLSPIYTLGSVYVHQGRVSTKVPLSTLKAGFKVGMFAATKKPFNFRPKKIKSKR